MREEGGIEDLVATGLGAALRLLALGIMVVGGGVAVLLLLASFAPDPTPPPVAVAASPVARTPPPEAPAAAPSDEAVRTGVLDAPLVPRTPQKEGERPVVDVVFCLDATGSMGDEIAAAKDRIFAIADRVLAGEPPPRVRFGVVAYRDRGEPRELDTLELTPQLRDVHRFLSAIAAGGGGDTPENVRLALKVAVQDMAWDQRPGAVKMIFLVGDAPPHEDYEDLPTCEASARLAHEKGIAISTIACGNLPGDAKGMATWRRIATFTGGRTEILPRGGRTASGEPAESGKFSEMVIRSIVEEAKKKGLEL